MLILDHVISIESLKAGAGPTLESGATLQDGGVWVAGHDKRLMRIPSTEAELNSTTFKKQNCIPNMGKNFGSHYLIYLDPNYDGMWILYKKNTLITLLL